MRRLIHRIAIVLAICTAPTATLAAQEPLIPEPISADAPTARQARAVADLLLAGDRTKLEEYLKAHAAPSYLESASFAADLTQALEIAKTGPRSIVRMDGLGKVGVAAALGTTTDAAPERAIVVRMDPAAPHRITGIQVVRIRIE